MWEYVYPDELYHHGRKGMKWGQNIFSKRRERKLNKVRRKNLEKARDAKAEKQRAEAKRKSDLEKGKVSARKMTDQELQGQINRLQNEQKYKELVMETRPVRRLMSKAWSDAIVPGITEGGKELVKKTLLKKGGDLLGLSEKQTKSALEVLQEEQKAWDAKEKISRSKKNIQLDKEFFESRDEDLAARRRKQAQKEVDEYNAKREKEYQNSRAGETYRMKGAGSHSSSSDNVSSGNNYPSTNKQRSSASSGKKYIESNASSQSMNSNSAKKSAESGEKWVKQMADVLSADGKEVLTSTTVGTKED